MSIFDEAEHIRRKLEEYEKVKVKIALFGQPGSGKSSLINRLTGQKLAEEGVKTDQTTEAKVYDWQGLHLVDLPGYGTQRFPAASYLETFEIATFDIFLCVFAGKFHAEDTEFFHQLRSMGKICLFVRNKEDDIYQEGKTLVQLKQEIENDLQAHVKSRELLFFTSCRTRRGIAKLNRGIINVLTKPNRNGTSAMQRRTPKTFLTPKKRLVNIMSCLQPARPLPTH